MDANYPTKLVIGLGTGRCGTLSLATLLNAQPRCTVSHELHPTLAWHDPPAVAHAKLDQLLDRPGVTVTGDIASYYLPFVDHLRELCRSRQLDTRFICLKRPRDQVIASFERKVSAGGRWRNHWMQHDGRHWSLDPKWDRCFPKFDADNRAQAIGLYWDHYYHRAEQLVGPDFRIFETPRLNSREGVAEMLTFAGLETHRVEIGIHLNRGPKDGAGHRGRLT